MAPPPSVIDANELGGLGLVVWGERSGGRGNGVVVAAFLFQKVL